ncbi:MAG: response regulator [Chitinophagaceae bacterium]
MVTAINARILLLFSNFLRELQNTGGVNYYSQALRDLLSENNELEILIADDDDDDKELFQEAIYEISPYIKLSAVSNGIELMEKLRQPSLPDLLFLDLNMPGKNGFECLTELNSILILKKLPVVIYSTSANPDQIERTYLNGATFYIKKPSNYQEIIDLLYKLVSFSTHKFFSQPSRKEFVLNP